MGQTQSKFAKRQELPESVANFFDWESPTKQELSFNVDVPLEMEEVFWGTRREIIFQRLITVGGRTKTIHQMLSIEFTFHMRDDPNDLPGGNGSSSGCAVGWRVGGASANLASGVQSSGWWSHQLLCFATVCSPAWHGGSDGHRWYRGVDGIGAPIHILTILFSLIPTILLGITWWSNLVPFSC